MSIAIIREFKSRLSIYLDDYREAFCSWKNGSKVLSASIYTLFSSIGPAITFSSFLLNSTGTQYGTVEVLLSTALTGVIFSLIGGQPLIILGVTGPVSIFSETVYKLIGNWYGTNSSIFLPFMFWVSFWASLFHSLIAIFGLCDWVRYVTRFSCEVFGALIGVLYIYTAVVQMVQSSSGDRPIQVGLLTIILAMATFLVGLKLNRMRNTVYYSGLFRDLLEDYSVPLTVVVVSALYYVPYLRQVYIELLSVPAEFQPSNGRPSWIVDPMNLPKEAIAIAIIPGLILTILFFFDHNVSSLLAQDIRFNLLKPSAYNWDFLVVGLCILLTGLLGLPPTNGLIPQAPLHVKSLSFVKHELIDNAMNPHIKVQKETIERVVEQRVSNFLQSLLTGVIILSPFGRYLLASVPLAVLSGLFLIMAVQSFIGNQFFERCFLLIFVTEDKHRLAAAPHTWPSIHNVPRRWWVIVTLIQLLFLVVIFSVTLTPAAISFPVFIVLLVPIRSLLLSKFIPTNHLLSIDCPLVVTEHLSNVDIHLDDFHIEMVDKISVSNDDESVSISELSSVDESQQ